MKGSRGFTLIEMMVVVAIIALLATIAIPNYVNFQLRAKTAEVKSSLGAIRTCEEVYWAEKATYINCARNPASIPAGTAGDWSSSITTGWQSIGFQPKGKVYYSYIVIDSTSSAFTAAGSSDFDADGTTSDWYLDQNGTLYEPSNPIE